MIGATERSGPGLWANLACRKRFIDEKLDDALPEHRCGGHPRRRAGHQAVPARAAIAIPVYEVDLPVNIERKTAVVRRVLGEAPAVGSAGTGGFRA